MLRVGLTGGIACGKSTVGAMLARRGARYLSADSLAHQLYAPGAVAYDAVVVHFGREILNPDGAINRKKLASIVFPGRIGELNAIVHPAVIAAHDRWMNETEVEIPDGIAVVEAALLLEAGAEKDFDTVIVVACDSALKAERYARRMGVTLDEARREVERRSAAQFSDEEKTRRAGYVIENSGTLAGTEAQVDAVWKQLRDDQRRSRRRS